MKQGEEGEGEEGEAYPCRRSRPSRSRHRRGPVALGRARRLGLLRVGPWFFGFFGWLGLAWLGLIGLGKRGEGALMGVVGGRK